MTESLWWFSPLKINENGNDLLPSAHKVDEKSEKLNNASAFSIDMRRVFVNKSYDKDEGFRKYTPEKLKELFHVGANTNDLLISREHVLARMRSTFRRPPRVSFQKEYISAKIQFF